MPEQRDMAEHRHQELIEKLHRVTVALEAIHRLLAAILVWQEREVKPHLGERARTPRP